MSPRRADPPPLTREDDPKHRPEYQRIRRTISDVVRQYGIVTLGERAADDLALFLFREIEQDRATSSTLLGACYEQFGPLDHDKVRRLQQVIETRVDVEPGVCLIAGREMRLDDE